MMHKFLLPAALALLGATAQSASLHVTFDNPIFSGVPGLAYDSVSIAFPGAGGGAERSANVLAGRFQGTGSNVVGVDPSIFVDGLNDLYLYCYDLYQSVGHGWQVDYSIRFDGESSRTLDFLGAVNAVLNAERGAADTFAWLHPVSGAQAAAIQLGIWESRYEANAAWSLTGGTFRASALDAGTADYMARFFAAVPGSAALDGRYVMTLESGVAQDMITGDPPSAVPLPGTLALVLGALPLLLRRRRGE